MITKTFFLIAAASFSVCVHAADSADNKRMFQARSKVCLAAADAAKAVTTETMSAGIYNPDTAIAKHSSQGSDVQQVLKMAFGDGGLMRSVLIQSAGLGASILPRVEREEARAEIASFAYTSLLNQCVIEAMVKYGY